MTVAKARRIHQDGIRFQGLRYLDLTLAAYVGEWVTIRYDPRDLAEVRVFYQDRFLCRAICPELAGAETGLKDLVRARNARRRDLQAGLAARTKLVDRLLRSPVAEPAAAPAPPPPAEPLASPRLKRYVNE